MSQRANLTNKTSNVKSEKSCIQKTCSSRPKDPLAQPMEFLQGTIGNRAVARLIKSKALQAKLRINKPGDIYEKEANRVAEQVMKMLEPNVVQRMLVSGGVAGNFVQRRCPRCEEKLRFTSETAPDIEANINANRGNGKPLPGSVQAFFEPRFGYDFSRVRTHNDPNADMLNRMLNARAFTTGQDIFFKKGEYNPESSEGKKLLAHELTHTVQQDKSGVRRMPMHDISSLYGHSLLQRLGANPGCNAAERNTIHQAIYNARGWLNKVIPKLESSPLSTAVTASLRRNFGPTHGVAANAALIVGRLRTALSEISTIPIGCAGVADATCAANHCGHAVAGGHNATICSNVTLVAGRVARFQAGCVLHESLHAAFSRFTVDEYSGWHGASSSTATYPGAGTDPLLNADSYTTLVMDLS
jgi:hypothetical protein